MAASGSAGRSRLALNQVLIVAQVALSLFLLVGAGLFVRSLQKLKSLDAGFEREQVLTFTVEPGQGLSAAQQTSLYKQLLARLAALPGVRTASVSNRLLFNFNVATGGANIKVPGYTPPAGADTSCWGLWVGAKFFETMGMPLLEGRDFGPPEEEPVEARKEKEAVRQGTRNPADDQAAPRAAVINQTMARDFFGQDNPVGKDFYELGGDLRAAHFQVIGVVKDAKSTSLRETPQRAFYLSHFQNPGAGSLTFLLRTTGRPAGFGPAIERAVRELDPRLQVVRLKTMNEVVNESLAQERLIAQLASFFSLFALLLACIGLYGTMSYAVNRRTNEIGIRMALGAQAGHVMRLVMREVLVLVIIGAGIGLAAAFATTRLVASLLFGLSPTDPGTIGAATIVMIGVAALAGYLPARRASRVDPLLAIRYE